MIYDHKHKQYTYIYIQTIKILINIKAIKYDKQWLILQLFTSIIAIIARLACTGNIIVT